jgi:hypothetical protein
MDANMLRLPEPLIRNGDAVRQGAACRSGFVLRTIDGGILRPAVST